MTGSEEGEIEKRTRGQFVINGRIISPNTNEIFHGAKVAHIEPKSMEVLVFLVERAGHVASRDEIQDAIWGDVTVGQDSITNAIIKIRRAFGDDARNPQVIETIPKRGYRLVADVMAASEPRSATAVSRSIRSSRTGSSAIAALLVAVALIAATVFANRPLTPNYDSAPQRANVAARNVVTVAIAQFLNVSGKPEHEYLVRGVQETILTDLSRLPNLSVMQLSDDLHAQPEYILEGSILRSDKKIRIDSRLMDGETGIVLSTNRYDRPFADLIEVEEGIRTAIIDKLVVNVDDARRVEQARGFTDSIDAYDLFLRAQQALLTRDEAGNLAARVLYKDAITLDPLFARAYAGMALTYAAEYRNSWTDEGDTALARALELAQTALGIAPDMPEQYWVVAYVRTQQRQLDAAEAALAQATQYNPNYADAYALLGGVQTYAGRPEKTIPLLRQAMRLKPNAGYLYFLLLGRAYYFLGDCEQAQINLSEAMERNPSNLEVHLYHAACLVQQGQIENAEWEAEEIATLTKGFSISNWFSTYPMVAEDQITTLANDMRLAGLK